MKCDQIESLSNVRTYKKDQAPSCIDSRLREARVSQGEYGSISPCELLSFRKIKIYINYHSSVTLLVLFSFFASYIFFVSKISIIIFLLNMQKKRITKKQTHKLNTTPRKVSPQNFIFEHNRIDSKRSRNDCW